MDIASLQAAHEWRTALDDFRGGHPGALAAMLRSGRDVPAFVATALADVVERGAPKRRGAPSKLPQSEHRRMRSLWRSAEDLCEGMRANASELADEHGLDPAQVRGVAKTLREQALASIATKFGVDSETVRSTTRAKRR